MGMSIDEAIIHLGTYSSTMGSGQTTQAQHEDAKRVAIDTMRKYQKMQADYENRLKADMVAILTEIQLEIEEEAWKQGCASNNDREDEAYKIYYFIQQKIDKLKGEEQYAPTTKNDLALIHTNGLDDGIRCAMCTNSMKSDRGCDGSCAVNNAMYKAVMDVIENHIQPTTKNNLGVDCISREQALRELKESAEHHANDSREEVLLRRDRDIISALPSVTPQEPILDKVKQAREEIEHLSKYGKETYYRAIDDVLAILDKLIESEVDNETGTI